MSRTKIIHFVMPVPILKRVLANATKEKRTLSAMLRILIEEALALRGKK